MAFANKLNAQIQSVSMHSCVFYGFCFTGAEVGVSVSCLREKVEVFCQLLPV